MVILQWVFEQGDEDVVKADEGGKGRGEAGFICCCGRLAV